MHLSACCDESPRTLVGARHAEHMVARIDKLRSNRGADKPCSACNKNTHAVSPSVTGVDEVRRAC
jgi:hypothetical protein